MTAAVLQTIPLGFQWQTVDPFLFCVHHDDGYPSGNPDLGPAASLSGRRIGQDFDQIDGWNMYHGSRVPGFPAHPHRGFETVTFVRRGLIDHADSLGAAGRYGRGDVQWMTAGEGIVHAEMFPLLHRDRPNPLELFQIWMNLPAEDKLVQPHFAMLWDAEIPRTTRTDAAGRTTEITVVAGELDGVTPPPPPPSSWASRPDADVAIWHLRMDPGATLELPVANEGTIRTLYFFEGDGGRVGDTPIGPRTGVVCDASQPVPIEAATTGPVDVLVLQGRPIGEPVAQYGPFVMNTEAEIRQAFDDYRRTQFGGWPWHAQDPIHGEIGRRFARHADGRMEEYDLAPD